MAIVVACRCGQAFEADDWLAGKVVQCPACRSPLAVPTPVAAAAPVYVPRPRSTVSHEDREAALSLITILVVAAVILMVVVGLSIGLVCYLKGTNPVSWLERPPAPLPEQRTIDSPATAQPLPAQPEPAGPMPPPAISGLPLGWNFYKHPSAGFSALLPNSPSFIERNIETAGADTTVFILAVTQNDHHYEASREFRSYSIAPGQEAAAYEALLSRRTAELEDGKVEGSNNATVDGRLVCDAILRGSEEGREYRKYLRLIVSGKSLFQLSCRVPPGSERPAEIKAFLGNYRLQ
ncbi:MAG: hypothetical protein ACKVP0_02650 [Pirellulaceae bacterium]